MTRRIARAGLACLFAATLIVPALPTVACGPDFAVPTLTAAEGPDLPPEAYVAGRIGVILPSYNTVYLVIAYRYFSGRPLNSVEQQQFVLLWKHYHQPFESEATPNDARAKWEETRQKFERGAETNTLNSGERFAGQYAAASSLGTYDTYDNCLDDAYRTAEQTLHERAKQFGDQSAAFRSWLEAQNAVFQNCDGGSASASSDLPEAAGASLPAVIRADRDYQIAAAYFYAGKWDEAEKRFSAIADDPSSPWRATAGLVVARCEIRKATLGTDDPAKQQKAFQVADAQLRKIVPDPVFASVKNSAERLRGFIEYRTRPDERLVELSNVLAQGKRHDTFEQDLDDFAKLMHDGRVNGPKDAARLQNNELMDWLATLAAGGTDEAEAHMMARFQQTHSAAWLVGALTNADADTPQLTEMLEATKSVDTSSAAYLSIAFQRDRLLASRGQEEEVRREITWILEMPEDKLPRSSRNLFLALRMKIAQNLDEFLQFAPRVPADVASDHFVDRPDAPAPIQPLFDADASISMTERMPLSILTSAARSSALPNPLRQQVAIAAWTRAILLRNDSAAREIAPILLKTASDLVSSFATYNSAKDRDEREFAAIFILLHAPGMRPSVGVEYSRAAWSNSESLNEIDSYRDNWWCRRDSEPGDLYTYNQQFNPGLGSPMQQVYPDRKIPPPAFLNSAQQAAAKEEQTVLATLPSAPNWLAERTLAWANLHPEDSRVPEALHFAVRATRFGCTNAETGRYSKRAFALLHGRYAKGDWAKRTPFWFK
jgi:hypothetical protein